MKSTGLRFSTLLFACTFVFALAGAADAPARSMIESPVQPQTEAPEPNSPRKVVIISEQGYFVREAGGLSLLTGSLSDPFGVMLLEALESAPQVAQRVNPSAPASEYVVTNSLDSGVGSLRWAIEQSNTHPGPDDIHFSTATMSGKTISPASNLPAITDDGTEIDASWNWSGSWPGGKPGITINGGGIGGYSYGLQIVNANNVAIKGLAIEYFYTCISISSAHLNTIGEGASAYGGGRMLIRNCQGPAVSIGGSHDNRIIGSYIGTSDAGNLPEPNDGAGVLITSGQRNAIGGEGALEGNIIGSSDYGIQILGSGSISNTVIGNWIGIGMLNGDLANAHDGVYVGQGAQYNAIGGKVTILSSSGISYDCLPIGNDIHNNGGNGVTLDSPDTAHNGIMANNLDDNQVNGIEVRGQARDNVIGCNTVVRNDQSGIFVHETNTRGQWINSNYIGTDEYNTPGLHNGHHGVGLYDGAQNNLVHLNVIGNNGWSGVAITGVDTAHNWLLRNWIGAGKLGETLGNAFFGVDIVSSRNNPVTDNVIANNGSIYSSAGVRIGEDTAVGNLLARNSIYNNAGFGIELWNRSQHEISPPLITSVQCPNVSGIAGPPGGQVEIFSDSSNEGRYYEGYAMIGASGEWTYSGNFRGPNLTATVTDLTTHDTSVLSPPAYGVGSCNVIFLPILFR